MASQNPWKKQIMANKLPTNTNDNTPSPISQFPAQQKPTPAWMKKKQQVTENVGNNLNQAPWMKNNVSNQQNNSSQSSTGPAWMKNKQGANTSSVSPSQPAWMKANQQQPIPQQNSGVSNGPAWMQNKSNEPSTTSNVPAWKAGGGGFGADKKKKQEEERLKREQQERQRIERQQQQQKQRMQREEKQRMEREMEEIKKGQKLKQEQNERRQGERMISEDNLSKQREQRDKAERLEQERTQQQEQQRKQREQQQSNKKPKPKPTSSTNKHSYSIKTPPTPQSPILTRFLHYYSQSLNSSLQYKQLIQHQKQLIKLSRQFSSEMKNIIVDLVKSNNQTQKKVLSPLKKNKIINMPHINTQLYYAFCQGQQQESTLNIKNISNENQKNQQINSVKFDMSSIERLQRVFTFYNHLNDIICSFSKKQSSMMFRFRIPLFTSVHFKGITFLCESYTTELLETQSVLPWEYTEIVNDFRLIEKELKDKYHYSLGKNDLMVKKLFVEEIQQEVYVIYLKNWDVKNTTNSYISNATTIQQLAIDYYYLSQINDKRIPLIAQQEFTTFKKVKTLAFSQLSDVVHLAQSIFIVYSSCQGEVQQKEFWELILSQSQQIWNLIRCAGYKGKLHKNKRFIFKVFQAFSGVSIKFEIRKNSKQQKLNVKECRAIGGVYYFGRLQINQMIRNFEKYLKENKLELAQHSLSILKQLEEYSQIKVPIPQGKQPHKQTKSITQQQQSQSSTSITYILKQSKYLIFNSQFRKATILLQEFIILPMFMNKSYVNIPIKMELLALYIKLKQQHKVLNTFRQLLQLVEFYYGQESLLHAVLYQLLASFYSYNNVKKDREQSHKDNVQNNVVTLYQHATSIILKFYGDQSQAIAQLYLSRAVAFLNLRKYQQFTKDIQHSLKIFKSHSKQKDKIAQCLFYKGRQKLQEGKPQHKKQGIQLIEQSSAIYLKLSHYLQAVEGLILLMDAMDQKVEENIRKFEGIANLVIDTLLNYFKSPLHIQKTIKITLRKIDPELLNLIIEKAQNQIESLSPNVENNQMKTQNLQELVLDLEQIRRGFQNFVQIIRWMGRTAFSMTKSQNNHSSSKQRFDQIAKTLGRFLLIQNQKHIEQIQEQSQHQPQQDQELISNSSAKQNQLQQDSVTSEYSPIKLMSRNPSVLSDLDKDDKE